MLRTAHSPNGNQRNTRVISTANKVSKPKDIKEKLLENKHDEEIVLDANREELWKSILIFYKKALNDVCRLKKELIVKFSEVIFCYVVNYFLIKFSTLKVEVWMYQLLINYKTLNFLIGFVTLKNGLFLLIAWIFILKYSVLNRLKDSESMLLLQFGWLLLSRNKIWNVKHQDPKEFKTVSCKPFEHFKWSEKDQYADKKCGLIFMVENYL